MYRQPWRAPFKSRPVPPLKQREDDEPPAKKRRISPEPSTNNNVPSIPTRPSQSAATSGSFRKPVVIASPTLPKTVPTPSDNTPVRYYNVLYRKFTNKKHKTWDGDGVLTHDGVTATLQDISGASMGKTACKRHLETGGELTINGKEVEIDSEISREDFLSGRVFLGTQGKPTVRELDEQMRTSVKFNAKTIKQEVVEVEGDEDELPKLPLSTYKAPVLSKSLPKAANAARPTSKGQEVKNARPRTPVVVETAAPTQSIFNPGARFKNPVLDKSLLPQVQTGDTPVPRFDPNAEGAVVMRRPLNVPRGKQVVDVVVDPFLSLQLRDHQKEGAKFLYECVMGMRPESGVGAILADEMGLGKTLQVITLLWTLFKQNPIWGHKPVIKKALIVCPATLIKNWKQEIHKWLGKERLGVYICEDSKSRLSLFADSPVMHIMVIGYEKLRIVQEDLRKHDNIDIVIADEGHRLKTAKNKAAEAIKSLKTERRIILSGTPLQNDLTEFYMMVDFVNPGLLGKPNTFKKEFEVPILRASQPGATEDDIETGKARSEELAKLTSVFILRRTSDILSKYLKAKSEFVIFCDPTDAQAEIYRDILASSVFGAALGNSEMSLQLITILKKVCNSPHLLRLKDKEDGSSSSLMSSLSAQIRRANSIPGSGKLRVCDQLLWKLNEMKEKVVIVSHYTSTLDMLGNLLASESLPFLRLDGTTPTSKRQALVNRFNNAHHKDCFAFLLSAKSGGAGLNLIGASRLILYDIDWNPATDLQAMARIHRDGQTKPCQIYRLLTRGALDEKIYQRQVSKLSLSDSVIDNKDSKNTFTKEELRRLFTLDGTSVCQTHDLLSCTCGGRGGGIADIDRGASKTPTIATPIDTMTPEPSNDDEAEEDVVIDLTAASPDPDVDAGVSVPTLAETDEVDQSGVVDDSDDDLPPVGALIKASQFEAQARAIQAGTAKYLKAERFTHPNVKLRDGKEGKTKMGLLMGYDHIDAMLFKPAKYRRSNMSSRKHTLDDDNDDQMEEDDKDEVEEVDEDEKVALIEDEALRSVLEKEECLIRYIFAKTTS